MICGFKSATKVAVILPAYNEEQTICDSIELFYQALPDAEVWVINNRSNDATEKIARATLLRLGCRGGVINEARPGKGNAIRRAFLDIDADFYVLSDADLTYPAEQVYELMAPLIEGVADMVVGDRHSSGFYAAANKRTLHGFGNWLVRNFVNKLFNAELTDIMSGYRLFNRRFVKSYPILRAGGCLVRERLLPVFQWQGVLRTQGPV